MRHLRLASYNIQAGIDTRLYRHYVTHSWKHVLPSARRNGNLERIAAFLRNFDVVGLQEVDGGSLRSGFIDQTEYMAHRAGIEFWHSQINRNLGKLAQHSNAFLSRFRPWDVSEHKLPGLPGRGALLVSFGAGRDALRVCVLHLALGRRARLRQVGFVRELLADYPNVVLMGDMNCTGDSEEIRLLVSDGRLREPPPDLKTFPSWRPQRSLDHILVSEPIEVDHVWVPNYPLSDHLPVAMDIRLPETMASAA